MVSKINLRESKIELSMSAVIDVSDMQLRIVVWRRELWCERSWEMKRSWPQKKIDEGGKLESTKGWGTLN